MKQRLWLSIFGAAFLVGAASLLCGELRASPASRSASAHPTAVASQSGTAPTTTSKAKKKKTVSSKSRKRSSARVKGQTAPASDRVKEIQSALQREGLYDGQPTGKWDDATSEAMRKYQDKNGINPTGKIDAISLEKLGLGSQTAGKGAPIPVASAPAAPAATSSSAAPSPADSSALPAK